MIKILNKGHTFQTNLNAYSKQAKVTDKQVKDNYISSMTYISTSIMIKYEINTHTFLQYKQCCLVQNDHALLFLE